MVRYLRTIVSENKEKIKIVKCIINRVSPIKKIKKEVIQYSLNFVEIPFLVNNKLKPKKWFTNFITKRVYCLIIRYR